VNWGGNVNEWEIERDPAHPGYWIFKCNDAFLWCSDHAGSGGAWYIKSVSMGKPTAFRIQEWEPNGKMGTIVR
jgi:hypothetical protein